jgi:hypothetical protein
MVYLQGKSKLELTIGVSGVIPLYRIVLFINGREHFKYRTSLKIPDKKSLQGSGSGGVLWLLWK